MTKERKVPPKDAPELNDHLKGLSGALDRFEKAEAGKDGERKFGLRAPYSDARSPKPKSWAN